MPDFLLDTFTGTGTLATHVGDVNAAWSKPSFEGTSTTWPGLTRAVLDGAGAVQSDVAVSEFGAPFPTLKVYAQPSAAWPDGEEATIELVFNAQAFVFGTSLSLTIGDETQASPDFQDAYINVAVRVDAGTLRVEVAGRVHAGYGGDGVFYSQETNTGVSGSSGEHTLALTISADRREATCTFDGNPSSAISIAGAGLPASVLNLIVMGMNSGNTAPPTGRLQVRSIRGFTAGPEVPPTPSAEFWTDFQGSYELP